MPRKAWKRRGLRNRALISLGVLNALRYHCDVIKSFANAETELLWDTGRSRRIPANLHTSALKKLRILHRSSRLSELNVPPGNRLEALTGKRKGQHSIRINDQFRICFVFQDGDASDVEIVDYH
jgi:toxin HigB-1